VPPPRTPLLLWLGPCLAALACAPLRFDPVTSDGPTADGTLPEPDASVTAEGGAGPAPAPDAPVAGPLPDAPPDPSGPTRCPGDAVVCDGFEAPGLDSAIWNPFAEPGATLTIDSTRAARGIRSVHLHVDPRSTEPVGLHTGPISAAGLPDPVYVRFFLFMPEAIQPFGGAFVSLDNDANQGISVDWDATRVTLEGVSRDPAVAGPPHGRWVCMRVKAQTGSTSELSLFIDGATTPALSSPLAGPILLQRVMFAISPDGAATGPTDLWIDEVLVSRNPVGCDD
jgi:hypothetical protein